MEFDVANTEAIAALVALLRGELAAVETYGQALRSITGTTALALTRNRDCHQRRSAILSQRIVDLGGIPAASPGAWGVLSEMIGGSARVFGHQAALAALEQGELRGVTDCQAALGSVDPASQAVITGTLLPQQKRTEQVIDSLTARSSSGTAAGTAR